MTRPAKSSALFCAPAQARSHREDDDGNHHAILSRDFVRQVTVEQRSCPGAQFQRGHQPALDYGALKFGEGGLKVLHDENGAHDALVVAVHQTTQGSKGTSHENVGVSHHSHNSMCFLRTSPPKGGLAFLDTDHGGG